MRHPLTLLSIVLLPTFILANTEKVIFIAPPAPLEPLEFHRALETLSPSKPAVRKIKVQLSFERPTEEFFVLEALDIGRKYEVRVCWPASTPTEFNLVIEPTNSTISPGGRIEDRKGASKTYLRLSASPAFVSHRSELMENPPPVYFDLSITRASFGLLLTLVLDPLVFGVIPESLLPVIGYAVVVGLFAWLVLGRLAVRLIRLAARSGGGLEMTGSRQKLE